MKQFLLGLITEDDGKPSFSRCASGLLVLFSLAWVTFVVIRSGKLPDQIGGAGIFLSSSLGTLYSANKVAAAFTAPASSAPCIAGANDKQ